MSPQSTRTIRETLVAAFRENPPKTSRELAAAAQAIWDAYPSDEQDALNERYGHWFFPDVPGVGRSTARTLAILTATEKAGYDVSLCWDYWDLGMAPAKIRTLLDGAKRASKDKPGPQFTQALDELLTPHRQQLEALRARLGKAAVDVASQTPITRPLPSGTKASKGERDRPAKAPAKVQRKSTARQRQSRATAGSPSHTTTTPEANRHRSQPPPPTPTSGRAALNRRHLRLVDLRSAQLRVTPGAYIEQILERDAEQSGMDVVLDLEGLLREQPTSRPSRRSVPQARSSAHRTPPRQEPLPVLTERLKIVMGTDDVDIVEAIKRLKAKGRHWVPNSGDLRAYVSLALSTHKGDFIRLSRGVYCVLPKDKAAAAAVRARAAKMQQEHAQLRQRRGPRSSARTMVDRFPPS